MYYFMYIIIFKNSYSQPLPFSLHCRICLKSEKHELEHQMMMDLRDYDLLESLMRVDESHVIVDICSVDMPSGDQYRCDSHHT